MGERRARNREREREGFSLTFTRESDVGFVIERERE